MALSSDLLSQFAKVTKDETKTKSDTTVYGTIVLQNGEKYVRIDGSDLLTPISSTTNVDDKERVTVMIKNHMATVTGNISSPAARGIEVDATNESVRRIEADYVKTKDLEAEYAKIENLDATYANIDFANIGTAAMEYFYAKSGLIKNVTVGDQTITGELVGVTIRGDRIIGDTVIADKLVIKGSDGLFYKLNTDGMNVEAEQTSENSLNGSIITAKSITATKISVSDLVAFDATIGGFKIEDTSIHSIAKTSVDNTTRGLYLGSDGQMALGDASNFLKYYKDTDGKYKLAISADSFVFSSDGKSVAEAIDDIQVGGTNYLLNSGSAVSNAAYNIANYQFGSMKPVAGETYTLRIWGSLGSGRTHFTAYNTNGYINLGQLVNNGDGTFSVPITWKNNAAESQSQYSVSTPTQLQIYQFPRDGTSVSTITRIKLEKGNKETDWSPAPEDTDAEFENVRSEISVTKNEIKLAVEDVQIGGRNYILGTGASYTATNDGSNLFFYPWPCADTKTLRSLYGKTLTLSFDYNASITSGTLWIFANYTWQGVHKFEAGVSSGHVEKTFNLNACDSVTNGEKHLIYINGDFAWNGSVTFSNLKVEIGNKATDWSPAPEDVQTGNENLLDDTELTISNGWVADNNSWNARNGKRLGFAGEGQDSSKDISANFGEIYITPGSYTVSCYAWQWNLGGVYPTLYFDMYSPDRTTFAQNVMATTLEDTASGGAVRKYTGTLNVTGYTGLVSVRFIIVGSFSQGDIGITEWKLERGNNATDWSPYREQFSAGTNVLINKDQFSVTTPEFNVNITSPDGTERMLNIDETGIHAQSIDCPNVAQRYDGPGTLYVNPNATSAQIAAGNYFRSLADAFAVLSEKQIAYSVTINLAAGMTEYGNVRLRGVSGPYWIYINGNSSNRANLVGQLDLSYNKCMVRVQYLNVNSAVNTRSIFVGGGASMAIIQHCTVTGKGVSGTVDGETNTGSVGIYAELGSNVQVTGCELYDTYRSLYVQTLGQMQSISNKGNCTIGTNRSHVFIEGTAPCESTTWTVSKVGGGQAWVASNVTVDQGSKPSTPTVTTTTVSYTMTNADVYAGGGWNNYSNSDIYQGYTSALGEHRGCFWFDNTTIRSALNGKTIKQVTLSLYQMSGSGRNQPVQVNLEGITVNYGASSTPYGNPEYGVIGTTLGVNQITTFTIPTKVITDLVAGTINGLMLRTGETAVMSGQDNSYHFARFAGGTTTSYRPMLTITYT